MPLYHPRLNLTLPASVDWHTKGAVSPVMKQVPATEEWVGLWAWLWVGLSVLYTFQGQCCSSYAFSAIGAIEGAQALASGSLTPLSTQNIVDCSGKGEKQH